MNNRFLIWLVLGLGAGLALAGVSFGYQEFRAFSTGSPSIADRPLALSEEAIPNAPSVLGQRNLMQQCDASLRSRFSRRLPEEPRQRLQTNCLELADQVSAEAPSSTFAWYVGALAAAQLGDMSGFNSRHYRSQVAGPWEQWAAERRVDLAEDYFSDLDPQVLERHLGDLTLLAQSNRGVRSIASRYVSDPDFRERITLIVETLPQDIQQRFLSNVQRASREVLSR